MLMKIGISNHYFFFKFTNFVFQLRSIGFPRGHEFTQSKAYTRAELRISFEYIFFETLSLVVSFSFLM